MLTLLALLRGLHLLCLVSLLGTLTARCVVAPGFDAAREPLVRLARGSLLLGVATLIAWLLAQAAAFADAVSLDGALATVPSVVLHTRFGHVLALRLALLVAAWPLIGRDRAACILAALLAAAALALQAALGHAGAAAGGTGAALLASESLHLIAAGAWLGGLLPLLVMLIRLPLPLAAAAAQRFAAVGLPAVLVLMATALVQGDALIGGLPGLFGTEYGHVALLKLVLFTALLAVALVNRFVLTARFEQGRAGRAALAIAVGLETLGGIAVLLAASVLAGQEPGMHVQPIWPFPLRPSSAALVDPDIRLQVMMALGISGGGLMLALGGIAWRRGRIALMIVGLACLVFAAPRLRPLLVPAYPTSYVRSPTGFAAASIVRGAAVFATNCAGCHGAAGRGDGPAAAAIAVRPSDLTAAHLWHHSDGDLFWRLTHGADRPGGGLSMPGFAATLSEADRWAVIDFVRANNAGIALRTTGVWPAPVPLPQMPLVCADGSEADTTALRGRPVEVLAGLPAPADQPGDISLATVHLQLRPDPAHVPDGCLAATPDAWPALAILTGARPAGTVVLVDASGWLRAVIRTDGETDAAGLIAPLLYEAVRHPLDAPTGDAHAHH